MRARNPRFHRDLDITLPALSASVQRGRLSRAFVCLVDMAYAVLLYRRVKRRGDESETRGPIKRAAIVLLDGSKPQSPCEIRLAGTLRRDVETKRRESWVMTADQGAEFTPLAKLIFGATNFAT